MKANILRRAEEAALADEDEDLDGYGATGVIKAKGLDVAFEEELDDVAQGDSVKVRDGAESDLDGPEGASASDGDDDEDEDKEGGEARKQNPETVLELAYLRDAKLFERDGQTRRSKARAALKEQTGWTDEQIEGWKIMLERNVRLPFTSPSRVVRICDLLMAALCYHSLIRTRSWRSTSSRAISPSYLPRHATCMGETIVVVAVGAVAEAVAAGVEVAEEDRVEEEDRAMQRGTGHGRTRIRRVGRITTGRVGTTKRWHGLLAQAECCSLSVPFYLSAYTIRGA